MILQIQSCGYNDDGVDYSDSALLETTVVLFNLDFVPLSYIIICVSDITSCVVRVIV